MSPGSLPFKNEKMVNSNHRINYMLCKEEFTMDKNLTELVFILDESGSMSGLERDTLGGYNTMLKKQQKGEGQVYVSTVMFADRSRVVHDRVRIDDISLLTEEDYTPHGCTALLDAIGDAVKHIGNVHKYARPEDRPAKTLFVITTDGEENASQRYSYAQVKKLVEKQKDKYGWEFIFLGANIDAIGVGTRLGVSQDRCVDYECDDAGVALNFNVMEEVVSCVRECDSMEEIMSVMNKKLEIITADYKKRTKK